MHQSALGEGVTINENDVVNFEPTEGDRGPKAEKVTLGTEGAAEEPAEEATEETSE